MLFLFVCVKPIITFKFYFWTASSTIQQFIPERLLDHAFYGIEPVSNESSDNNDKKDESNGDEYFKFTEDYTQWTSN